MTTTRIDKRFEALADAGRAALVTFVTAGDPCRDTSLEIIRGLPAAGADVIEIGMPFSDPMADGPAIQAAGLRALQAGQTLAGTLDMVAEFRKGDEDTPVILMGYYNPIYSFGPQAFLKRAKEVGVDGLIIVDLPPETDDELCLPAMEHGISFIRLATPTTDAKRLPRVIENTSGFVYYVSVAGITGTKAPDPGAVGKMVAHIKQATDLPVCVGFGVTTPEQAESIAKAADGVVVGSALVEAVRQSLNDDGSAGASTVSAVHDMVSSLADGVARASRAA